MRISLSAKKSILLIVRQEYVLRRLQGSSVRRKSAARFMRSLGCDRETDVVPFEVFRRHHDGLRRQFLHGAVQFR